MAKRGRKDHGVRRAAYGKMWGRFWRRAYRQWRSHQSQDAPPPPRHVRVPDERTPGFEFPQQKAKPYAKYLKSGTNPGSSGTVPGVTAKLRDKVTNRNPPHWQLFEGSERVSDYATHPKKGWGGVVHRGILRRSHKEGRLSGTAWLSAAAFRVWCANGCHFWPKWDPDGRQPVQPE